MLAGWGYTTAACSTEPMDAEWLGAVGGAAVGGHEQIYHAVF